VGPTAIHRKNDLVAECSKEPRGWTDSLDKRHKRQNMDMGCKEFVYAGGTASRVPGYGTEMYCVSCEVRTEFIYVMWEKVDRLCGLVVRVPGCGTEMYCDCCEVRTECIYVMWEKVDRLCGLVVRVPGYGTEMYCDCCEVRTECIYVM
jgi:hypothetical protein